MSMDPSSSKKEAIDRSTQQAAEDSSAEGGVDRRLLFGLAGGVAGSALLGAAGCRPEGGVEAQDSSAEKGSGASGDHNDFEWLEAEIETLQAAMTDGRTTSVALTEAYLSRIEKIDNGGPRLNSVIEVNPDALEIAAALDRDREQGTVRGPLHGVPILVKDNIATADKMTTTAGSLALEGSIPRADSFVASQLRRAGAVILGKANLSEWANIRSTNSSSGWSARGGQCKNPFALERNPCGSSSGSGAAASANLCAAAIGTETNGSIMCPSSVNGVVGIKPTLGLVSRTRIIPIAHSQDTAGPMARTLRDATHVLSAIVGVDPEDEITSAAKERQVDYSQFLDPAGLSGKRLGVVRNLGGFDTRVDDLLETALDVMKEQGAEVVDVNFENGREMGRDSYTVLLCELKTDLALYLEALGPDVKVKTLADVIAFNEANAEREMPYFGQEIFLMAEATKGVNDPAYEKALKNCKRLAGKDGIDKIMVDNKLDALVAATGGPAWVTDLIRGDHSGGGSSSPAAIAGYPNITVPMGYVHGLPVGISFFGRAFTEPQLLPIAYGYEQATGHRRAPDFRATAIMDA